MVSEEWVKSKSNLCFWIVSMLGKQKIKNRFPFILRWGGARKELEIRHIVPRTLGHTYGAQTTLVRSLD